MALGTFVAIHAEAATESALQSGIAAAFAAVMRVQTLMHPLHEGSDLARLNRAAGAVTAAEAGAGATLHEPVAVDAWTWQILALCQRLHRLSDGVFDPCLPADPCLPVEPCVPVSSDRCAEPRGRLGDLELPAPHIVIPHARVRVDLGGIAKGFAVDRAIDALRASGCSGGLVNAGGDLAVFGERSHEIVVRQPGGDSTTAGHHVTAGGHVTLQLRNAALATSVVGAAARPREHQGYYGGKVRAGSVAIWAPSAAVADALTKCVLIGSEASNRQLLERFGAREVRV